MHCVEILRELAAGGRSIITTIHQPSSRLYQSLDKLLLLSQVKRVCVHPVIALVLTGQSPEGPVALYASWQMSLLMPGHNCTAHLSCAGQGFDCA